MPGSKPASKTRRRKLFWIPGHGPNGRADELPLRCELLSTEQLCQHAIALAPSHQIDRRLGRDRLLPQLAENESVLLDTYELVSEAVEAKRRLEPAAEWLLDNFYLIEEQIRTARRHLPKTYSRQLPRLVHGPLAGYPRVYAIALELISHIDGKVDADSLLSFVEAYQSVTPLQLGELWAIPIMLRLALIDNLRRVAGRIAADRLDRDHANLWADRLLETAETEPRNLVLVLADLARSDPPMTLAFVAELSRRLRGHSVALAFALSWIEHRAAEQGWTIEQAVQQESQAQAADQVSIGNNIGSLRFLSSMDWREFVETTSLVEQILRTDPGSVHERMNFATRDRYRHVVEEVAKCSRLDEPRVAQAAIDLAGAASRTVGVAHRTAHVGYYLVDQGRADLDRAAGLRWSLTRALQKFGRRFAAPLYIGSIVLLTGVLTAAATWLAIGSSAPAWLLAAALVLLVLGTSQLAAGLVNWAVPWFSTARALPRMDFSKGIPPEARTLVAVPTLLLDPDHVSRLVESLEVHWLANRDDNIQLALLTDFRDAPKELMPGDAKLLDLACEAVVALNKKYHFERDGIFLLLHRDRRWNPQEQVWMGYERKRGKLADLNAVLRGAEPGTRFDRIVGDVAPLRRVRYVITLDSDTQLPRDAARQLSATLAHPLNHPVIDAGPGCVRAGYAILQPRVGTSLVSAARSWFARIECGEPGVDHYTRIVSDVYQDLFGEGSFIGKGIYDVDAFEHALAHRFPENLILSHDLVEGCHARSALVSDLLLYEDYPSTYAAEASRRHRWIRGDWQIVQWLLPRVPRPDGARVANPLSLVSRWKIFDNLRRSLVPPALVALLIIGWVLLPLPWFWTLLVVAIVAAPQVLASLVDLARKPSDLPVARHARSVLASFSKRVAQAGLTLTTLPHEAWSNLDAVVRTVVRMTITRRKLLEWTTAGETERRARGELAAALRLMWVTPLLVVAIIATLWQFRPDAIPAAAPLLGLWFVAPALVWWISRPVAPPATELEEQQIAFLHRQARKTWRFFETFLGPEDNWLPPDNYQEYPVAAIAHRTSPTNIGLALLANLAAHDFGYIPSGKLLAHTAATFATLARLQRFHRHFYNWYDTRTLEPLLPRYVSTVDSGNFSAHLLVLQAGLAELGDAPIVQPRQLSGLADTIDVFLEMAGSRSHDHGKRPQAIDQAMAHLAETAASLRATPATLSKRRALLDHAVATITDGVQACTAGPHEEITAWGLALEAQARECLTELDFLAPWIPVTADLSIPPDDARKSSAWQGLREMLAKLEGIPTLNQIAHLQVDLLPIVEQLLADEPEEAPSETTEAQAARSATIVRSVQGLSELRHAIAEASTRAGKRLEQISQLVVEIDDFAQIDYDFLYDRSRNLLTIGYNVESRRQDNSFYDLLASEARLTSFIGIAEGHLPQSHWFSLGRLLTTIDGDSVLLSWSGSMFEYLMPLLVMPSYENSLLDQTCKAAVHRHIEYGRQRGVPWGISESGYNTTDAHLNYQYRAFGVPGLGFKRGLGDDLVVAPYATMMALVVAPRESCENLERMAAEGYVGAYGYYEAIDFTPSRVGRGNTRAIVRSFMAHHQGMGLLGFAFALLGGPMQRRFEANPLMQSVDLLLQERIPNAAPVQIHTPNAADSLNRAQEDTSLMRVYSTPHTPFPDVHLLSNGTYHVMVTVAGGGYSRWNDTAVTRWHADTTRDDYGQFCYLRDRVSGEVWSIAHQPALRAADGYEAIFLQGRAEYRQRNFGIETHAEIAVSSEDDIELRRVNITNRSRVTRTLELTSYGEVVLTSPAADASHPAFSNLFVQTEIVRARHCILCTRRPRSSKDQMPWMVHLMAAQGNTVGHTSYETDRSAFLGRARSPSDPAALTKGRSLSNSEGSVLDPIVAIRRAIQLEPDETASIDIVTGVAATRELADALADKYHDRHLADRVFELAWTHSQVMLRQLNISETDAQLFGQLASSVVYAHPLRRASPTILLKNRRGQSGLWGYGISGDLPIVLLRIGDPSRVDLVRQMVQAHAYWRSKGLAADLVIWNEDPSAYRQSLHDEIVGLIAAGPEGPNVEHPGGIFVRRADQMPDEDRVLLQTVARVVITDTEGTLAEQVARRGRAEAPSAALVPLSGRHAEPAKRIEPRSRDLALFNGIGGFSPGGHEYVIATAEGQRTAAPWSNVLANPHFGSLVSESGGAYTWCENAHEFRLTPWYNDPVTDRSGEAFYIRDDDTTRFWSPTPLPAGGDAHYVTRHGFGYSAFECSHESISSEMVTFVALDAPVKFVVLRLRNESARPRRLSVYGFVEWVLGDLRPRFEPHVTTEIDPKCGALLARNFYNLDFSERIAFFDSGELVRHVTGDRAEFLGRNGHLASPAALGRVRLSGKVGAGLDPCGAIQLRVELVAKEEKEIVFILGAARDVDDARTLVQRFRGARAARTALEAVQAYWRKTLGAVTIETPDQTVDLLANGWLVYQTLACRMWARSGYYQSGGAFGFRDQLQDAMALVYSEPRLLREHLLRAAERQFREGDVQHWWHVPTNRGVRTHFSDDYLWLPLAVHRYVACTGDTGVLDETVPYLEGRPVNPDEEAYYDLPQRSEENGTLYDHCVRAIQHGLRFGAHGLPLMGCGDWNDGMNLVGAGGKGESVWLAFFLYDVLLKFSEIARRRGDMNLAESWTSEASRLRGDVEAQAWDGGWYLRAFFDDGTPLGTHAATECQIDALPQSWAVLSGAGDRKRAVQALEAVDTRLVRRQAALVQLFDPPFDKSEPEPGYIKGYVPGVRENGGQYTHAAVWTVMAFAALRDPRAWELFALINPLRHASNSRAIATYKVEPYVVAADVYAVAPHVGRGGWTWYTGSAGWMYRLILESLLGLRLDVDRLFLSPLFPPQWTSFEMSYRYRETTYQIRVTQARPASGSVTITVDGIRQTGDWIPLVDDRQPHTAEVVVG
jgi:cyclic beta-1,2-glucan synthetase